MVAKVLGLETRDVWGQEMGTKASQLGDKKGWGQESPWVGDKRWGRRGPSLGTRESPVWAQGSLGWGQEVGTKGSQVWGQEENPQFGDKGPWVGDEMGTKGSQFGDKKGWGQEVEIRESQFGDKRWGPRGPSLGTRGEPPVWGQRPSGWGRVPRLGSRVLFWGQMPPGWGQEPWFGDKGHWDGKCPHIGVKG